MLAESGRRSPRSRRQTTAAHNTCSSLCRPAFSSASCQVAPGSSNCTSTRFTPAELSDEAPFSGTSQRLWSPTAARTVGLPAWADVALGGVPSTMIVEAAEGFADPADRIDAARAERMDAIATGRLPGELPAHGPAARRDRRSDRRRLVRAAIHADLGAGQV